MLTSANSNGGNTTITGTLNSTASTAFRIEFFSNAACDSSGNGEGQVFLGATNVTTDAGGNASINVTLPIAVANGQSVTATATNTTTNDTSEFSACQRCYGGRRADLHGNEYERCGRRKLCVRPLLNANASTGTTDTIVFNIAGTGVKTITPISPLPTVTDPVIIDGYTQPGSSVNTSAVGNNAVLLIELDGSSLGNPINSPTLLINNGSSTVRGLVFNRNPNEEGIRITGGTNHHIEGNFIGTNATGATALPNSSGVTIQNSTNNTIGGLTPAARNLISGNNGDGLALLSSGSNTVQGNYIGTNAAGTAGLGNNDGLKLGSNNNTIGGAAVAARNVISGNDTGINLVSANGNTIQGNYIGTNATGTGAIANTDSGIRTGGGFSSNNLIGGTAAGAGNLISGNGQGVEIRSNSNGNILSGNLIGTDAAGTSAIANTFVGINVNSVTSLTIGGTAAGDGNRIAFNSSSGVLISANATGILVSGNSIFSNGQLGIDLGNDGVTPNDAGDADTGANNLQNFPVLASAVSNGSSITIQGTLNSTASTTFRVEFFSNAACDSSGNGEGQVFLGATNVTTDAGGNASINVTLPIAVANGQSVTATATNTTTNDTSEFSACVLASSSCATPPANMAAWYPGDGSADDIEGGNDGTLQNGATANATGKVAQAFSFPNSNSGVLLGNPASLQLQDFTIDAWVQRSSLVVAGSGPTNDGAIVAYGHDGYGFGMLQDGQIFLTKVDISIVTSGASLRVTNTAFHHVAVTKSGNTVVFYVDGVAGAPLTYNDTFAFTKNISIGARLDVSAPTSTTQTSTFAGIIDEVEIFSRALSQAEVHSIFSAGSAGKCKPSTDLSITKTDSPDPVTVGSNLTYTITATNNGPDAATGVNVSDALPAGTTFVSANASQGACTGTTTVNCALGSLANGASATVQIVVMANTVGALTNTATVSGIQPDPNAANNSATATTTVNASGADLLGQRSRHGREQPTAHRHQRQHLRLGHGRHDHKRERRLHLHESSAGRQLHAHAHAGRFPLHPR